MFYISGGSSKKYTVTGEGEVNSVLEGIDLAIFDKRHDKDNQIWGNYFSGTQDGSNRQRQNLSDKTQIRNGSTCNDGKDHSLVIENIHAKTYDRNVAFNGTLKNKKLARAINSKEFNTWL